LIIALSGGGCADKEVEVVNIAKRMQHHNMLSHYDSTITLGKQALIANAANADIYVCLGLAFANLDEGDSAMHYCDAAINADSNNLRVLEAVGYVMANFGRYEDANNLFDKMLKIDSNCSYAYAAKALDFYLIEEHNVALDLVNKSLSLDSSNPLAWQVKSEIYADHNSKQRNLDSAIFYINHTIRLSPSDWKGYYYKARAFYSFDRYDSALSCINIACQLHSNSKLAVSLKSESLLSLKRYDEAILCLERALAFTTDSAEFRSDIDSIRGIAANCQKNNLRKH
jgi:tetratricopeptide (TPR) repeat protein